MRHVKLALLVLAFGIAARADQINFNFTVGGPTSVTASKAGGMTGGPSELTSVSDSTTNVVIPTAGTFVDAVTGPATSFIISSIVVATFQSGGFASVLVEDAAHNVLVSGVMADGSTLLSTIPAGAGSFLGTFHVEFVDAATLAKFDLGPGFDPVGSVAFTFAGADVNAGVLTASLGGGSVTIQSTESVPEAATMLLVGSGLVVLGWGGRRRWRGALGSPDATSAL